MKISFRLTFVIFSALCVGLLQSVAAASLQGTVVDVIDGGTITVNVDKRLVKVRLCTVTPPAKTDALSEIATGHLASMIKDKKIGVEYKGLDGDGSIAGIVTLDGLDVGMQLVRDGAGSYNKAYESVLPEQTRRLYEESEQAARREARGIWQQIAPPPTPQIKEPKAHASLNVSELNVVESPKDKARRLSDEANVLIQKRDLLAALPKSIIAIQLDPTLAEAHKNLALALCDLGRYAEALPSIIEAIRLKPELDKSHNVLGKILLGLGDNKGAVKSFGRALSINPAYSKAWFNLGVGLLRLGENEKALIAYGKANALTPNDPATLLDIGIALYQLGRHAEAQALWKKVLTMDEPRAALQAEDYLRRTTCSRCPAR